MIWHHTPTADCPLEVELKADSCVFCGGIMDMLLETPPIGPPFREVRSCGDCGWWTCWLQTGATPVDISAGIRAGCSLYGVVGELKALDVTNLDTPIDEVRRYLVAKYEARFDCHPRLFEETVTSVFCAIGYQAEATAYSRDGGVDVILRHSNGTTTGIQVKRSRNPIEVDQLRSLAGALLQGDHTSGKFVTTSRFTYGARRATTLFEARGYPIELIDANRFLEALRISQRPAYAGYDEWREAHGEPTLHTVYEDASV